MLEMRFAIIEKRNANEGGMEDAEKFVEPGGENERFVDGFVRRHDQAILHESDHEPGERVNPPERVLFHAPERRDQQGVSGADVRETVGVALLFAERRNFLAQIDVVLERSSHA